MNIDLNLFSSYFFNIVLIVLGIFFYTNNRKDLFCVFFYLVLSSGLNFIPLYTPSADWALLMALLAFGANCKKKKKLTGVKGDRFALSIILFLSFVTVRSLYSLFSYEENLNYIFRAARSSFFWLAYFTFREISYSEFCKAWERIRILIFVFCLFNFAQYFGFSFVNYHSCSFGARLGYPLCVDLLFLWAIIDKKESFPKRLIVAIVSFGAIFFAGSRFHTVLTIFLTCVILMGKIKFPNKKFSLVTVGILFAVCIFSLIQSNSLDGVGRFGEVKNDVRRISEVSQTTAVKGNYLESGNGATMTFRLVLAKERLQYLLNNPQYLLWGIGPIYDDAHNPKNRFNFYLGTVRSDLKGIHQIDTVDISFVTVLFRYGVVGFVLLLGVLIMMMKHLYEGFYLDSCIRAAFYTMVMYVLQCLGSNYFDRFIFMAILLVIAGAISYEKRMLRYCNS